MINPVVFYKEIPIDVYKLATGKTTSWKDSAQLASSLALRALAIYVTVVGCLCFAEKSTLSNALLFVARLLGGVELVIGCNQANIVAHKYLAQQNFEKPSTTKFGIADYLDGTLVLACYEMITPRDKRY